MLSYCNHCRVTVRGKDEFCPLCHNLLPEADAEGLDLAGVLEEETLCRDVFPYVESAPNNSFVFRLLAVISIGVTVICYLIYFFFPSVTNWPLLVLFGLICLWMMLLTVLRKRKNVVKTIIWQLVICTPAAILLDLLLGKKGWSFNYVIPILWAGAMVAMSIVAPLVKLAKKDYIIYLILGGVMGFLAPLFISFGWTTVLWPSVICTALAIIFLAAVVILNFRLIFAETRKRLHF